MPKLTGDTDICTEYFNGVYDDTFDYVKRYVASKCSDPSYIADILQETYCEFYKLILKHGVDHAGDARALLIKIAKRRVFRYYSLRRKLAVFVPLFETNRDGEEYCIAEEADDGEDGIIDGIEAERIWSIIGTYPAETRKILYLYFSCGMSHSEIATQLGCGLSYVKNKIYRTLAEIKEKENCDEAKQDKKSI